MASQIRRERDSMRPKAVTETKPIKSIADAVQATSDLGLDPNTLTLAILLGKLGRLNEVLLETIRTEVYGSARHGSAETWVLVTLFFEGPPFRSSPTELCQASLVTSGGMTKALHALERAGLIERSANAADGRARPVQLTAAGRESARDILACTSTRYAALFSGTAQHEIYQVLRRLLSQMERLTGKPDTEAWLRLS
jgi:DNA-binding MarR family transcriptional regulator